MNVVIINWLLTYMDIIIKIAQIIVASIGVFVAWRGLKTWQRQMHGQNKYELARKILLSFYQARYQMQILRSPVSTVPESYRLAHKKEREKIEREEWQQKFKEVMSKINELHVLCMEAHVVLGNVDAQSHLSELLGIFQKVRVAVLEYLDRIWTAEYLDQTWNADILNTGFKRTEALKNTIYSRILTNGKDEIDAELTKLMEKVKNDFQRWLK